MQDRLVIAFERVHRDHHVAQREFCQTLGLSERTFHSWRTRSPSPRPSKAAPPPPTTKPASPGASRRGRFDLAAIPPGVEITADTTDLDLFDIPLKLIAAQDPGRRDSELCAAFNLDVAEDARRVAAVVEAAVRHRPAAQIVTDQGTPYCAAEARVAYEALGLEHAPTKEGAPTQKATIERAFGTLKPLLAHVAAFTSTLAAAVPALRTPTLAVTIGKYLIALALDAHRLGSSTRIVPAGTRLDHHQVESAVEAWVHRRREGHKSCKLLLERIHEEYRMEGAREAFVRALRRHQLEDIGEAELRLRTAACRCQARVCDRYFAGILRNVAAEAELRRKQQRNRACERARSTKLNRQFLAEEQERRAHPDQAIGRGLDLIAVQWQPTKGRLFMQGRGMGTSIVRQALVDLCARDGPHAAGDGAELAWRQWTREATSVDAAGHDAIRSLWDRLLTEVIPKAKKGFSAAAVQRIINPPPLPSSPRSPP